MGKEMVYIFIIFLMGMQSLAAQEKNVTVGEGYNFYAETLMGDWHPGYFCIECHATLLSRTEYNNMFESCGGCHNDRFRGDRKYGINMNKISNRHGNIICVRCHSGSTGVTRDGYHNLIHSGVECGTCHRIPEEGKDISVPGGMNCNNCHGGGIHDVHSKKLEDLCVICHGERFGLKYAKGEAPQPDETSIPEEDSKEDKGYAIPTVTEIIRKIIEVLFK